MGEIDVVLVQLQAQRGSTWVLPGDCVLAKVIQRFDLSESSISAGLGKAYGRIRHRNQSEGFGSQVVHS